MYHHKKDKPHYKSSEITHDLVKSRIPGQDFIAVFGTSHTAGRCELENKKYTHIDESYRWANIVGDSLGLPIVNFAIPGNTNEVIVQQLIDFFEDEDFHRNCKLVLAELRLGDISGRYFFDTFAEDYPYPPIPDVPFIAGNFGQHWLDNVSGSFVPKTDKEYLEKLVWTTNDLEFKNGVPTEARNQMKRIIDVYCETALCSSQKIVEDILHTRTITHICNANGVPFRYFNWDLNKISLSGKYFEKTKHVINDLYNLEQYNFKKLMPNVNVACPIGIGNELWNTTECECGHRNHVVHQWVAENIVEELKNDFCS